MIIDDIALLWSQRLSSWEISDRLGLSHGQLTKMVALARESGDERFTPRGPGPRVIREPRMRRCSNCGSEGYEQEGGWCDMCRGVPREFRDD
jgi:hypothetical protein